MSNSEVSGFTPEVKKFPWVPGDVRGAWVAERLQKQEYGKPEILDADRPRGALVARAHGVRSAHSGAAPVHA